MDVGTVIAVVVIAAGNAIGWLVSYGRIKEKVERNSDLLINGLSEKVQAISESVARNEGLTDKVDSLSTNFAELRGTVLTFIKMSREKTKAN